MNAPTIHELSAWEEIKDDVMRTAVRAKFAQHGRLKRLLLETGDARLAEHSANDAYWADGGDGRGRNMPGVILMEIRGELRTSRKRSNE
jgi:ribA/ribD-fused uncharacterized protein